MSKQSLVTALEQLGVKGELEDNQQIVEVLMVCKVIDFEDGATALGIFTSNGVSWIDKLGLLEAARRMVDASLDYYSDDE